MVPMSVIFILEKNGTPKQPLLTLPQKTSILKRSLEVRCTLKVIHRTPLHFRYKKGVKIKQETCIPNKLSTLGEDKVRD